MCTDLPIDLQSLTRHDTNGVVGEVGTLCPTASQHIREPFLTALKQASTSNFVANDSKTCCTDASKSRRLEPHVLPSAVGQSQNMFINVGVVRNQVKTNACTVACTHHL